MCPSDSDERCAFAVPPARGTFEDLDLALLDPDDPDDRRFLILAEHPELAEAIDDDVEEVEVHGRPISPNLHITLHEIVANQLWDDDPPEVWETAKRLLGLGYERHDVRHMIMSAAAGQIWALMQGGRAHESSAYVDALRALPGSWEALAEE